MFFLLCSPKYLILPSIIWRNLLLVLSVWKFVCYSERRACAKRVYRTKFIEVYARLDVSGHFRIVLRRVQFTTHSAQRCIDGAAKKSKLIGGGGGDIKSEGKTVNAYKTSAEHSPACRKAGIWKAEKEELWDTTYR